MRFSAIALLLLLAAPAAHAQRVLHRVRLGETLASISSYYYGSEEHAKLVALANGLDPAARLRAGDHLRVPTAWTYTLRRAASLEELAKELLGDRRRWQALSIINKVTRKKRLKAGKSLIIPFTVTHLAVSGDTYAELATRFYGSSKFSSLVASYNFANGSHPLEGTQVEIPIGHVRIDALRLEELTNHRLLGVPSAADRERREAVQEANALLRQGEYFGVPLRLVQLLAHEIASDEYIADVYKLLAIAYVALDRNELAVRAFQEALLRQPSMALDQVATSPKVIRAYIDAKTKLQRGTP